jgi:hypothetical protein
VPVFRGVTISRLVKYFLDGYDPRGRFLLFSARADLFGRQRSYQCVLQSDANVGTVYPRFASAPGKSSTKFNSTPRRLVRRILISYQFATTSCRKFKSIGRTRNH